MSKLDNILANHIQEIKAGHTDLLKLEIEAIITEAIIIEATVEAYKNGYIQGGIDEFNKARPDLRGIISYD